MFPLEVNLLLFLARPVIEVCSGDYGDFADRMVTAVDNGRCTNYCKKAQESISSQAVEDTNGSSQITAMPTTTHAKPNPYKYDCSTWNQFKILLLRMWLQMWRDKVRVQHLFLNAFFKRLSMKLTSYNHFSTHRLYVVRSFIKEVSFTSGELTT